MCFFFVQANNLIYSALWHVQMVCDPCRRSKKNAMKNMEIMAMAAGARNGPGITKAKVKNL